MRQNQGLIIVFLLALMGIGLVLFKTKDGIGIAKDSGMYTESAEHYSKGDGLSISTLHSPPLYPIILSMGRAWNVSPETEARWLNAFFFGFSILLAGLIVQMHTQSGVLSILGSLLMFSKDIVRMSLLLMTETMFTFLILFSLLLFSLYIKEQKRSLLLAFAGITALVAITKFGGIAVIILGIVGLIFLSPPEKKLKKRIIEALIFTSIAATPFIIWLIWNYSVADRLIDRTFVVHLTTLQEMYKLEMTMVSWFFGSTIICVFFIFTILCVFILYLRDSRSFLPITVLLGIGVFMYIALVIITNSFFDASTSLGPRILEPAHVLAILFICTFLHLLRQESRALLTIIITGICAYLVIMGLGEVQDKDLIFNSAHWRNSETIQELKKISKETIVFSNGIAPIRIYAKIKAFNFPSKVDKYTLKPKENYLHEIKQIKRKLNGRKGIAVFFYDIDKIYSSIKEVKQQLPLKFLGQYSDGIIYQIEQTPYVQ